MDIRLDDCHRAMQYEAQMAAQQFALGVTSLRKASFAKPAFYMQAFFGLSIGLERMCKIVILSAYLIENNGKFPDHQYIRKYGHNLLPLLNKCEKIVKDIELDAEYIKRPSSEIHNNICYVLSKFAVNYRYHYIDFLTGTSNKNEDPIALWWKKVAEPILEEYYKPEGVLKKKIEERNIAHLLNDFYLILFRSETGESINDIEKVLKHSRANKIVQKYGGLYALQLGRWLSSIIQELSYIGAYDKGISALFGLNEPFVVFLNKDSLLKRRKRWSIYFY